MKTATKPKRTPKRKTNEPTPASIEFPPWPMFWNREAWEAIRSSAACRDMHEIRELAEKLLDKLNAWLEAYPSHVDRNIIEAAGAPMPSHPEELEYARHHFEGFRWPLECLLDLIKELASPKPAA